MRRIWGYYQRHFSEAEFMMSLLAAAAAVALAEGIYGRSVLMGAMNGSRQALYTALASAGGSLLGFILTAVTVVLTVGQMPRFNLLKDAGQYEAAFGVFFSAIQWLAIGTIWAIVGLVVDTDTASKPLYSYGMLWLIILSSLRVYRCVWLLKAMAAIAAKRPTRALGAPAPGASPS